jgi:hypothetical protein
MAKEEKIEKAASNAMTHAAPGFVMPDITGKRNLSAVYPTYVGFADGSDARNKSNLNKDGAPIQGYGLGIVDLPSQMTDRDGNPQEWKALVIELTQPTYARLPVENGEVKAFGKGDRIVVTLTAAIDKPDVLASFQDPHNVHEFLIQPRVGKTKTGQSLWLFPLFVELGSIKRTASHKVSSVLRQLPTGNGAGRAPGAQMPSDEHFG